jgi:TolA-binding protein
VLYAQKKYSAARGEFDRYLSDAPEAPDSGDVRAKAGTCEKLAKIEGR